MDGNISPLLGMSLSELKDVAKALGMPPFTGGQIAKWLYTKHVGSIDEMTDISKQNREKLKERYTIGCMSPAGCQRSKDGTVKYLFPTAGGKYVEIFNSDAEIYGGSGMGNPNGVEASEEGWNFRPNSISVTLPPLATIILVPQG